MFKVLFLILIVMSSFVFAQTKEKPQAIKFDEFVEVQEKDWKEKIDKFYEVATSKSDVAMYIVVYAKIGERNSIDTLSKQYLDYAIRRRTIDPVRISITCGGYKPFQTTELWLLPTNAELPEATPIAKFEPELFAEILETTETDLQKKYEEFLNAVGKSNSTAYVINYGTEKEMSEREKIIREAVKSRKYDSFRITFISGGNIGVQKTVFWIVSPCGESPKP